LDPRSRFIDLVYLLLIQIPSARAFNISYTLYKKIIVGDKGVHDIKKILFNRLFSVLCGVSIFIIFIVSYVTNVIITTIYDEYCVNGKKCNVVVQILISRFISIFSYQVGTALNNASRRRIFKDGCRFYFNPMIGIALRLASNKTHKTDYTTIQSANNKTHTGIVVDTVSTNPANKDEEFKDGKDFDSHNTVIRKGIIFTHSPMKGQRSISVDSGPNARDNRTQKFTINTS
jgi:hypothetical protein